ncbi:MAG: GAF domain-containing sensor histidine kinase [Proteobacteria bacterium]|nr:MAG: GAF domain-containing sensor histidine kinase [Pseudomonadota bacterium]
MLQAPKLADEEIRLKVLRDLEILDTAPETAYDQIVELAALACQTHQAMLSFIDDTRQWVKAGICLPIREAKREESFCTHTIASPDLTIVHDPTIDPRFKNSPHVLAKDGVRFYAGAPIILATGEAIGALCVMDNKPRTLTEDQKKTLTILARIVVRNLEIRKVAKHMGGNSELVQALTQTIEVQREKLIASTKLALVGRISAGVHHELNTPLSIIGLQSGRLQNKLGSEEPVDKKYLIDNLKIIDHMVDKLSRISKGMLSLARAELSDETESVNCQSLIEDAVLLASNTVQKTRVKIIFDPNVDGNIECVSAKTIQILTNLLANAAHAAAHGSEEPWIRIGSTLSSQPGYVKIHVDDSGPGIAENVRKNLMKPFFSTKPASEGNGLGLNLSQNLAVSMGGSLELDSSSERTRFVLQLPMAKCPG